MVLVWLNLLGFLGFTGIAVLILIYLLKPKYQQKFVSSTFVWQLALRYRKKKIPIDPFRNLLVFLFQMLVLVLCSLILAQPRLISESALHTSEEEIIILDASAGMRAKFAGEKRAETRFERAVQDVKLKINDLLIRDDGVISVILADKTPHFLVEGAGRKDFSEVVSALDGAVCSLGAADMETALVLAQEKLFLSPSAKVTLYTGTQYGDLGGAVTVKNLADPSREWNIAILNCSAAIEENEFVFSVDVGAFGNISGERILHVDIKGAQNGDGNKTDYALRTPVGFEVDANNAEKQLRKTVRVRATDLACGGKQDQYFSSFEEVSVYFSGLNDSISDDDSAMIYGGEKDSVKIQYQSSDPNTYFYLGFHILMDVMQRERDLSFRQVYEGETPELNGFDYYIFEHNIPKEIETSGLPRDGVVLLWDPDREIEGLGVHFGETVKLPAFTYLNSGELHPLTQYLDASRIGVSEYRKITEYDESFRPLLFCGEDPLLLVKDGEKEKIILVAFSINQSNLSFERDFVTFLYDLINHFMPRTLEKYAYEIGESAELRCKGISLEATLPDGSAQRIEEFPARLELLQAGTYTFRTRFGLEKSDEIRKLYVRIPQAESGIFRVSDLKAALENGEAAGTDSRDLFFWLALAAVALLFAEWILQFRDIV